VAPGFCPVSDRCFRHENTARKGGATKNSQARCGPYKIQRAGSRSAI